MKKVSRWVPVLLAATVVAALSGCSGSAGDSSQTGAGAADSAVKSTEPVKLTVYQHSANITDEEFAQIVSEPVKKKYPNITMELIHTSKDNSPETLVANGTLPDMIYGSQASEIVFSDLSAVIDLTDLIKKNRMDLSRFDPAAISQIQMRSPQGQTLAIPLIINFSALYYNKDLFDKFAVPYPKDGLTWEDLPEIASKLTQNVGGVQYTGWGLDGGFLRIGAQLSLTTVDPKTNKATLATDGWKRLYGVMKPLYDIPGFNPKEVAKDAFIRDQTKAMIVSQGARVGEIDALFNQGKQLNWGMATLPSFKEAMGKAYYPDLGMFMITSATKHKEEAFNVISLLTTDEAQIEMGKSGRLGSLKDPKTREKFGQDVKALKGVNLKPMVNFKPTPEPSFSRYSDLAGKQVNPAFNKALAGTVDINTALREAEDLANKDIAAEMEANGGKK
ncbi:MAG: extracellular solute-binding protein family 1 [Paenibacillaceae bacterium]|jgi:multiple sugar transport system substrate-binding protein|nr:extracellular solute-binding protein family 1 [Paenibacillaceae bacterium]